MTQEHRINIMEETPVVTDSANQEETLQYASVLERFVALLIDYGIIFFPLQLITWIVCKMVGQYLSTA